MEQARKNGRGLRLEEWAIPANETHSAAGQVIDWARTVIAASRRPFGIDAFDLAIACRRTTSNDIASSRFLRLRPIDLYSEGFAAQLASLFPKPDHETAPVLVAAAIFSWGDAAHQALPARI